VHHLVEAVANGRETDDVFEGFRQEEARKKILVAELIQLDALTETISLNEKRIVQTLRARLGDLPALFGRHVPLARQMLRKLLDGHIMCEPIVEGGKPGYRFMATGTFDRLLTGIRVGNDGGGGHPQPALFHPTIRVPLVAGARLPSFFTTPSPIPAEIFREVAKGQPDHRVIGYDRTAILD
jgi:hypothetical protein